MINLTFVSNVVDVTKVFYYLLYPNPHVVWKSFWIQQRKRAVDVIPGDWYLKTPLGNRFDWDIPSIDPAKDSYELDLSMALPLKRQKKHKTNYKNTDIYGFYNL
jgi:hypothetical protein